MDLNIRGQEMRDFFNDKIDSYDQVHESFMDTKIALVDAISCEPKKVLDLGAGTGLELIHLFELYPNCQVTVVDITENMLEELQKRNFAKNVTCICGDFFLVDFGNDYDAVISTSALHHFNESDKLRLYKKVLECLKDNGEFINCDKVCLTQEEQDTALEEYMKDRLQRRHMDTPLTVENEIKVLSNAGFNEINVYNQETIKDNYALIKCKKTN